MKVNVFHPGVINTELGRETWAKLPRAVMVNSNSIGIIKWFEASK